jgi:hypothetical protein
VSETKKKAQYGLLIRHAVEYGTEKITIELCRREEGRDHPIGCGSDGENQFDPATPQHVYGLQLDELGCYGHVSDYKNLGFIGFTPEYRNVFSADLPKLARMTKTLKKVVAQQRRDNANEPGDVLMSLAKALKLSFVAMKREKARYDGTEWNFMTITEGRNCLRRVIEEALAARNAA